MSILAVNNLTKIYTVGGDTTAALDHVSFSVE
ncbi:MAG: ABC transporter ATP-binding protein, partial [Ruminococcus sp.]|nr:ABC transporter ATP-binding protein [Ruminococcus sp.]